MSVKRTIPSKRDRERNTTLYVEYDTKQFPCNYNVHVHGYSLLEMPWRFVSECVCVPFEFLCWCIHFMRIIHCIGCSIMHATCPTLLQRRRRRNALSKIANDSERSREKTYTHTRNQRALWIFEHGKCRIENVAVWKTNASEWKKTQRRTAIRKKHFTWIFGGKSKEKNTERTSTNIGKRNFVSRFLSSLLLLLLRLVLSSSIIYFHF